MQYPLSVAVTWQTSFDQLTVAGRELLNLLAWFAPEPIPETLLADGGPWGDGASDSALSSSDPLRELSWRGRVAEIRGGRAHRTARALAGDREDAPSYADVGSSQVTKVRSEAGPAGSDSL